MSKEFDEVYANEEEKRIPEGILNESIDIKKWFLIGFYAADGNRKDKQKNVSFSQKYKILISGLNYLCQSLGLKTCFGMRDDKFNAFYLNTVMSASDEKVLKIINFGRVVGYVHDLETESHDFNFGFPLIVHNTDSFILSMNIKDIIKDLKSLEDRFDFTNLDEKHENFSNKNKKVTGEFKLETPKNNWRDDFICLRSKHYSFKCGDDSKKALKGISKSQSKHNKFEDKTKMFRWKNFSKRK